MFAAKELHSDQSVSASVLLVEVQQVPVTNTLAVTAYRSKCHQLDFCTAVLDIVNKKVEQTAKSICTSDMTLHS